MSIRNLPPEERARLYAARVRIEEDSCRPACREPEVVRAELQALLGDAAPHAWVAGGFAVMPDKATDVDVFMGAVTQPLGARLIAKGCELAPVYGLFTGQLPSGMPLHVVPSAFAFFEPVKWDIRDVLAGFDIKDQMKAWNVASGDVVDLRTDSPYIEINWTAAKGPSMWLLARVAKLAARYRKPIAKEDLARLVLSLPKAPLSSGDIF